MGSRDAVRIVGCLEGIRAVPAELAADVPTCWTEFVVGPFFTEGIRLGSGSGGIKGRIGRASRSSWVDRFSMGAIGADLAGPLWAGRRECTSTGCTRGQSLL